MKPTPVSGQDPVPLESVLPQVAPPRAVSGLVALGLRMLRGFGYVPAPLPPAMPRLAKYSPRRFERVGAPMLSPLTMARAERRLATFAAFDAADYAQLNPDVGTAEAVSHALSFAWREARPAFRPGRLARALGAAPLRHAESGPVRPDGPVGICVSSRGNIFMAEIADQLAAALTSAGLRVVQLDETSNPNLRPRDTIIIAPHEFFVLGRGPEWRHDAIIANAIMLNTEQPQTQWFVTALPFLFGARGVIDVCAQLSSLFEACGQPSLHLALGAEAGPPRLAAADRAHPLFRVLPPAAQAEADPAAPLPARALDVAFFGARTEHRQHILWRCAPFLAEHRCFIYCRNAPRPIEGAGEDATLTRLARHVAGHAAIMLNLHRDSLGYFEWHRIVQLGMSTGSVVVSEPCLPHPDFRPGQHYFEEVGRHIPQLLRWLLHSADGQQAAERVRTNAWQALAGRFTAQRVADEVCGFLERAR